MVEKTGSGEQQLIVVPYLLDNSLGPRLEGERRVVCTWRRRIRLLRAAGLRPPLTFATRGPDPAVPSPLLFGFVVLVQVMCTSLPVKPARFCNS